MTEQEIPKTMKAWTVTQTGDPKDALSFTATRPAPQLPLTGSNILVRITHAGLNPADLQFMRVIPAWLPFRRNPIPGLDLVGTVAAAGPSAPPSHAPGTVVCGCLGVRQVLFGKGTLAEYVVVPAELVAVKPARLGAAGPTGCGIAGQTAVLAAREAGLREGQRVLINGASGGVGSVLVQIVKARGASVVGVCSGANKDIVKSLGANEIIDYTAHDDLYSFMADTYGSTQRLDVIIDCVGDDALFTRSPGYLQSNGKFLSIVGGKSQGIYPIIMHQLRPVFLGGTPRSYKLLALAPSGAFAREIAKLVEDGTVKEILVDSEFSMSDALAAYEKLMTKRAKGKIVVRVQD